MRGLLKVAQSSNDVSTPEISLNNLQVKLKKYKYLWTLFFPLAGGWKQAIWLELLCFHHRISPWHQLNTQPPQSHSYYFNEINCCQELIRRAYPVRDCDLYWWLRVLSLIKWPLTLAQDPLFDKRWLKNKIWYLVPKYHLELVHICSCDASHRCSHPLVAAVWLDLHLTFHALICTSLQMLIVWIEKVHVSTSDGLSTFLVTMSWYWLSQTSCAVKHRNAAHIAYYTVHTFVLPRWGSVWLVYCFLPSLLTFSPIIPFLDEPRTCAASPKWPLFHNRRLTCYKLFF